MAAKVSSFALCFLLLVLSAGLLVEQANGQKRCSKQLDPNSCNLPACQKECYQQYNGNGVCEQNPSGAYSCFCFYNCN
nr:defensin-like protein 155 [Ipomoea batatas]